MNATTITATTVIEGQERVVDTRFSYFNDDLIHVMRVDIDHEPYFFAVDGEFTSVGPTRRNHAQALLDGRRHLGKFRPTCHCLPWDEYCSCPAVRQWRAARAAGA